MGALQGIEEKDLIENLNPGSFTSLHDQLFADKEIHISYIFLYVCFIIMLIQAILIGLVFFFCIMRYLISLDITYSCGYYNRKPELF